MKSVLRVVLMSLALLTAAHAQIVFSNSPPPASPFGNDPTLHVTSTFRTAISLSDGQTVPDGAALEKARRELYQMTANECTVLADVYKADCRLSNVSIVGQLPSTNGQPANSVSATGTFELRLKTSGR